MIAILIPEVVLALFRFNTLDGRPTGVIFHTLDGLVGAYADVVGSLGFQTGQSSTGGAVFADSLGLHRLKGLRSGVLNLR